MKRDPAVRLNKHTYVVPERLKRVTVARLRVTYINILWTPPQNLYINFWATDLERNGTPEGWLVTGSCRVKLGVQNLRLLFRLTHSWLSVVSQLTSVKKKLHKVLPKEWGVRKK